MLNVHGAQVECTTALMNTLPSVPVYAHGQFFNVCLRRNILLALTLCALLGTLSYL